MQRVQEKYCAIRIFSKKYRVGENKMKVDGEELIILEPFYLDVETVHMVLIKESKFKMRLDRRLEKFLTDWFYRAQKGMSPRIAEVFIKFQDTRFLLRGCYIQSYEIFSEGSISCELRAKDYNSIQIPAKMTSAKFLGVDLRSSRGFNKIKGV
jgi:hypothetical protein